MTPLPEHDAADPARFAELSAKGEPFVMRGIAADWPLVAAGRQSPAAALASLGALASGQPIEVMIAPGEVSGKFSYGPGARGFNFMRQKASFDNIVRALLDLEPQAAPAAMYAGANETRTFFPGFDAANPLPHAAMQRDAKSRVWLGNRTEISTHFDQSDNIAVVALGRRRFTLFPPWEVGNLYIGPFDHTVAGQPISMADPLRPDLDTYPRFAKALEAGLTAELEPGDAIFIPTLWWHHVAALDPINVLVNYWYNDAVRGGPFVAFIHALWAIRDLPDEQRAGWRAWFEHYVFGEDAASASDHIPEGARQINGPASPQRSEMIRRFLLNVLGQ
jgi:hypothetical protein